MGIMYKLLASSFAVTLSLGTSAMAESWDMPVYAGEENYITQNLMTFAEDIERESGGELSLILHPESSLIRPTDVLQAIRSGQVPIGDVIISFHSNEVPIFGIDSMPFLANDYDSSRRLLEAARPQLEELLAERNMRLLFVGPWPTQGLYVRSEINSMEDLEGNRFRAYSPLLARFAELMGMMPISMAQADVPQGFTTGMVDVMITSAATGISTQAWDFVDHFYDVAAFIPWSTIIINEQRFQALDAALQEVVLEAAAVAEERIWQLAPEIATELLGTLEENGIQIHQPSEALEAEFRGVGDQLLEEWLETAGEPARVAIEEYQN